ncbi:unnamed protein product [Effrenium voratum]|nr:unnamed protein product [Effrenium voratum]
MAEAQLLDVAKIVKDKNEKNAADSQKSQLKRKPADAGQDEQNLIVKAPHPYPSRAIPSRALQEEDYVEAVSALIERDFFPDLPHLRARYELMQARLRGDTALVRALEKKLLDMPRPTPGQTPRTPQAETPNPSTPMAAANAAAARLSAWERDDAESVVSGNLMSMANHQQVLLRLTSGREVLVDLSTVRLDQFQQVFTSEDNASFEAVLDRDKERRRQKEWWVENSEEKHNTTCKQLSLEFQKEEACSTGAIMTCEFQARNTFYFKPRGESQIPMDKPLVESRNTRFTTQEQSDLDETLMAALAARQARENGQKLSEVLAKMVKDGTFSIASLHNYGHVRAVGGRLQTPLGGPSFPMVNTPAFLPGENGFSPLMTFGKIASTPRVLEEEAGPSFRVQEESARDRAAEKLAKGAMQRQRESKQNSKKERLKALGLTPNSATPSVRTTPASVASKVTPMSPIGQLLQRAQRMAQRGGRLKIGASEGREAKRQRTTPVKSVTPIPASLMADLL